MTQPVASPLTRDDTRELPPPGSRAATAPGDCRGRFYWAAVL